MSSYPTTLPVVAAPAAVRAQQTAVIQERPSGLRSWLADRREVRRVNRAYRRQRRDFDRALAQMQGSPSAQQELYAIWATRS